MERHAFAMQVKDGMMNNLPSETGKGMAVTECRGDCCQR